MVSYMARAIDVFIENEIVITQNPVAGLELKRWIDFLFNHFCVGHGNLLIRKTG